MDETSLAPGGPIDSARPETTPVGGEPRPSRSTAGAARDPPPDDGCLRAPPLVCSVGIMAYNEEGNIGNVLRALQKQQVQTCEIGEVIVLASGCTDRTEAIVRRLGDEYPRIKLMTQPRRMGKASAINLFLRHARGEILVLESADTLPGPMTIERLIAPFVDPEVGMTGGRPVPINDRSTFMGFAAHLLWEMHHQVALQRPKMGELIAFRRIFHRIPNDSAVDEANVEPLICGQGFRLQYVPEAVVLMRGPQSLGDFLKQRRRIYAGHLRIRRQQGYVVSTMSRARLLTAFLRTWSWDWRYLFWAPAVGALEALARVLGWLDARWGEPNRHTVWDVAATTKGAIE
jgi:poly-beta-1,6-N-acetyl-D-glucosamine synthase